MYQTMNNNMYIERKKKLIKNCDKLPKLYFDGTKPLKKAYLLYLYIK